MHFRFHFVFSCLKQILRLYYIELSIFVPYRIFKFYYIIIYNNEKNKLGKIRKTFKQI